jgi:uncharacterized protein involved in tolerance to divalent cations
VADYCQLWLTCKDHAEADKIANTLLVKQLIVCAKQTKIKSDYRWKSKIEHSEEVLLLMDSQLSLFEKIETEVSRLHSYDTFVLQAVPLAKVSKQADGWLIGGLRS